jgi:hypothetical protein
LKFAASFYKGEKIAIADPAFALRSVNGVLVPVGIVMEVVFEQGRVGGREVYNFTYGFLTYSTDAHAEIKSLSIDGLPGPLSPSMGDIKIGPQPPMPGMPVYEVHRSQGLHNATGVLVKGIEKEVFEAAVKRRGHVKVVASVKVVNNGKTEERDIVYIFEVERRRDF